MRKVRTKESREPCAIRISYVKEVRRLRTIYGTPEAGKREVQRRTGAHRNRNRRYFNKSRSGVFARPLS